MTRQEVIACDEQGRPTGEYLDRAEAHRGAGRRHLAIVVLLLDGDGRALLQRRKHPLFDGLWDLTGATHPLRRPGARDETLEEAAQRCLEQEYAVVGRVEELRAIGGFAYYAPDGEQCENEYCHVVVGRLVGTIAPNAAAAYDARWVPLRELLRELDTEPARFTPWAIASRPILATVAAGALDKYI
ncbi:MAG: NUDIX domain-containing protein [Chloroflexota bacterium]|nr:NUDIX domain-containing protein [Chloroflexota bacterium]